MSINEAISIVAKRKPGNRLKAADLIVSVYRWRMGMTYDQIVQRVQSKAPEITAEDWESLMYDLDTASERGDL